MTFLRNPASNNLERNTQIKIGALERRIKFFYDKKCTKEDLDKLIQTFQDLSVATNARDATDNFIHLIPCLAYTALRQYMEDQKILQIKPKEGLNLIRCKDISMPGGKCFTVHDENLVVVTDDFNLKPQ